MTNGNRGLGRNIAVVSVAAVMGLGLAACNDSKDEGDMESGSMTPSMSSSSTSEMSGEMMPSESMQK